ncbi:hypothetical protein [Dictyobacter arantiisoli]|uniref:Uncharacterized protein n=1 Tax=Dictyobacter arantiisoli TaxID=2014874 RepID=A0A5A5TGU0_9CHLR|nr:hypothetical protein [Dictyobacter arantiisoli]GCF10532.1 hypothetical protein KDI_40960 [Dictyobacter arantiisoli]
MLTRQRIISIIVAVVIMAVQIGILILVSTTWLNFTALQTTLFTASMFIVVNAITFFLQWTRKKKQQKIEPQRDDV